MSNARARIPRSSSEEARLAALSSLKSEEISIGVSEERVGGSRGSLDSEKASE